MFDKTVCLIGGVKILCVSYNGNQNRRKVEEAHNLKHTKMHCEHTSKCYIFVFVYLLLFISSRHLCSVIKAFEVST